MIVAPYAMAACGNAIYFGFIFHNPVNFHLGYNFSLL